MYYAFRLWCFFLILLVFCGSRCIHAGTLIVDGMANVFAAGLSSPPALAFGGGELPPVFNIPAANGQVLTFSSVTGSVSGNVGVFPFNGPDGLVPHVTFVGPLGGISGIRDDNAFMFLAGVFLDDSLPSGSPPPILNFTNAENFTELFPSVAQVFFIGDGLTGSGTGTTQVFHVPATATRLFLGFADTDAVANPPGAYSDNGGAFTASFQIVPEPGSLGLFFAGAIVFVGVWVLSPERAAPRKLQKGGHEQI